MTQVVYGLGPLVIMLVCIGMVIAVSRKRMKAGHAYAGMGALLIGFWIIERSLPPAGPDDPFGIVFGIVGLAAFAMWVGTLRRRQH